jgi:hypothetical protein
MGLFTLSDRLLRAVKSRRQRALGRLKPTHSNANKRLLVVGASGFAYPARFFRGF